MNFRIPFPRVLGVSPTPRPRVEAPVLATALMLLAGTAAAGPASTPAADGRSVGGGPIFELDTVTVTATRTENSSFEVPASVTTVTREQFDDAQAARLSTVMRTVPNVNFGGGPRPAGQIPAIRGFSGPKIILSVDGARRNNDNSVYSPLLLDPDLVKRVDVVRGPVSAAYGSGGLGGVMAFETLDAEDVVAAGHTVGGRIKAGYRTGNQEAFTHLATGIRAAGTDLLFAGSLRDYDRIRTGTGGSLENDGQLKTALAKGAIALNDLHRLNVSYQLFRDDIVSPNNPSGNMLFPYRQHLKRRQDQYTGSWSFRDADKHLFDGKASAYFTRLRFNTSPLTAGLDPTSVLTETAGASVQNTTSFQTGPWLNHRLTYGADFYRDSMKNTSAGVPNSVLPDGQAESLGGFVQDEIGILDNWTLTGTLLQDTYRLYPDGQNESGAGRLSPKVALKWQPMPFLGLWVGYGQAFRAPTLTETYGNYSSNRALFNFRANPSLKPETSTEKEVGITLAFDDLVRPGDALRAKATVFFEDVDNLIEQQTVGTYRRTAPFVGTGLIFQQRNVSKAERSGAEVEVGYSLGDLDLGLGYSRVRSHNADTGARLFAPPDKASLGVKYHIDDNWSVQYVGQFVAAQDYDATALRQRSGYTTHDVGVTFDRAWYRVDLGVSNLLDKAYVTYQATQAETYSYEEGRSINLTLTARF